MKNVEWVGDSLENLREFPLEVKEMIGHALHEVQCGGTPALAKSMSGMPGVWEIRVRFDTNAYRTVYIAKLKNAVYILHCFQKKSKSGVKTPRKDMEIIKKRLKMVEYMDNQNYGR